jgi:hypothetical protein
MDQQAGSCLLVLFYCSFSAIFCALCLGAKINTFIYTGSLINSFTSAF